MLNNKKMLLKYFI